MLYQFLLLIANAENKKAGAMIAAGTFLFLLAIGINTIYSIQTACLDVEPQQCYTGYDNLPASQQVFVSPGLYLIALSVAIGGVVLWFREAPMQKAPKA